MQQLRVCFIAKMVHQSVTSRGRGKVLPRTKKAPDASTAAAPPLAAAPASQLPPATPTPLLQLTDHSTGAQDAFPAAGSRLELAAAGGRQQTGADDSTSWRCAASFSAASQPVPTLELSSSPASAQQLRTGRPLLLPQQLARCSLRRDVPPRPDGNAATAAGSETAPPAAQNTDTSLSVWTSPAAANRFILVANPRQNLPGSYYHVRKPETGSTSMTFGEWHASWLAWEQTRLLLQADVCRWELCGAQETQRLRMWPNSAVWPHLSRLLITPTPAEAADAGAAGGSLSAAELLDWPALRQLLQDGGWALAGGLQLQAGGRDALLPARYEMHDRLVCQVAGRQRLLLLPPEAALSGLYCYPVAHPYDRYAAVDLEEPELEHWPLAAQLKGLLCDLRPGDTLLVPAFWSVHAQLMQPACVSLSVALHPLPTRLTPPPALLLQAARMVELWLGAEVTPANVRKYVQALSAGREWQLLQAKGVLTPAGSKLLRCCGMALVQLQRVLSLDGHAAGASEEASCSHGGSASACAGGLECAARRVLARMCDSRLVPTPWLNEGISDPLLLAHPPRYYLIEEDAEAARYSSLFRHRLIAQRPDWRAHATPLQLTATGSLVPLLEDARAASAAGGMQQHQGEEAPRRLAHE